MDKLEKEDTGPSFLVAKGFASHENVENQFSTFTFLATNYFTSSVVGICLDEGLFNINILVVNFFKANCS